MQHLTERLLSALDKEYNVTNMPVVVEIIGILEQTVITKEVLESTRLGRHINELRRKTSDKNVAKRAKDLVRKWRDLIVPEAAAGAAASNGLRTPLNKGHISPGLPARKSQPASPASRVSSLSPETGYAPSPAVSPRLQGYSPAPPAAASLDNGTPVSRGWGRSQPPAPSPAPGPASAQSRPRGRPPKNKNKHKRDASDLLPKSSPANKRLRKNSTERDVDETPSRVNGFAHHSQVPATPRTHKVKTTRELLQSIQQESSLDILRNKTLSSLGVVKTADKPSPRITTPPVQIPSIPKPSPSREVVTPVRTPPKMAVKRRASPVPVRVPTPPSPHESDVDVEKVSSSEQTPTKLPPPPAPPSRPETVAEILARLPPVNADQLRWSDDDDDYQPEAREVTDDDVRRLGECHLAGVNGNNSEGLTREDADDVAPHWLQVPVSADFGCGARTCPPDCSFREWQQTLSLQSYQNDLLHILPYVIID